MGDFHASNVYMSAIGDHIAGSELPDICIYASIITEGIVDKIFIDKD